MSKQGHECIFLTSEEMAAYFHQLDFRVIYSDTHAVEMKRGNQNRLPYREQIADSEYLFEAVEEEINLIQRLEIDLLVVDAFIAVPIAASVAEIPWVSHLLGPTWLKGGCEFFSNADTTYENRQISHVAEQFGVQNIRSDWPQILYSPYLNIASGLEEFLVPEDSVSQIPPKTVFMGGLGCGRNTSPYGVVEEFDPGLLASPSAFVSLGTLHGDPDLYNLLVEAIEDSNLFNILITTGFLDLTSVPRIHQKNIYVRHFMPAESILPQVDIAVIHGGFNSIMDCLFWGVPMVVVPANRGSDQPANGRMVENLGAGQLVDWPYSAKCLARSIDSVLQDKQYREKCGEISRRLRNFPGSSIVLNNIKSVLNNVSVHDCWLNAAIFVLLYLFLNNLCA
jgi:UDP:flavonoid glycosyltransferase YjiC (YdhE family)